jgi:glycosyltransferase involved in cell wall biosynthesis
VRRRPILVFPHAHQRGGVERITWQALRRLSAHGQPVVYVGHSIEPEIAGVDHVPVLRRGGRASAPWWFRRDAARALQRVQQPGDVVVSFGANCPPGDVCVVNSVHRSWLQSGHAARVGGLKIPNLVRYLLARHLVLLALERSYMRTARNRRVVAVSSAVADDLATVYGLPADRTVVIPNGYDAEVCSPERRAAHRSEQRAAWGVDQAEIVLLFVANELHRKGFDCLLDAVARTDDSRLRIDVVGRAPLDPYADRIDQLGLRGRVAYHGSVDIGLAHAAADVLALPTQYEAFALTVVEALASGLPVVTTTVPGAGDLIADGVNGLLQRDPLDADELAGLLQQIADPELRTRLGANGPSSVAAFEWASLVARLDDVIQDRT